MTENASRFLRPTIFSSCVRGLTAHNFPLTGLAPYKTYPIRLPAPSLPY